MLAKRSKRQAPAKMKNTRTVFTVLEGVLVFTAGPLCEWFRVEDVVGNSNIEDMGPTRRRRHQHACIGREFGPGPGRDTKCSGRS